MMNPNVQQAILMAQQQMRNGNVQRNPNAQNWMQTLQSGNQQQCEALANEIISNLGISKEQAIQQAMSGLQQRGILR